MNYIHESILRDVVSFIELIGDESVNVKDKISSIFTGRKVSARKRSISSMSSPLIMVFPILTSTNLEIENAAMVAKAQERKIVELVRLTLAANKISNARSGVEYLQQYHSNLRLSDYGVDDYFDTMDRLVNESTGTLTSNQKAIQEAEFRESLQRIRYDLKNDNYYFLKDDINLESIGQFKIRESSSVIIKENPTFSDKGENVSWNTKNRLQELEDLKSEERSRKNKRDEEAHDMAKTKHDLDKDKHGMAKTKHDLDKDKHGMAKTKHGWDKNREDRDQTKFNHDLADRQRRLRDEEEGKERDYRLDGKSMIDRNLVDNDVKKANELVHTTLRVEFISTDPNRKGGHVINDAFYAGIKGKMHPIESYDVIDRLSSKGRDLNLFQQVAKVSTGELSFFKDFLFAVDKAKIEALSNSKRGSSSKMWKVLERRANKQKIKRAIGSRDASAISISTLAISKEETDVLKRDHDLDLFNPRIAQNIMESYNLMSLVIVDQANEIANFIYDTGEDLWETVSFKHLERENSDSSYKKVVSLLAKNK